MLSNLFVGFHPTYFLGGNAELFAELFAKIRLTPAKVTKKELELFEFLKNAV